MSEEIETKLIDTPNEIEVEYWTNEWVNEDDIIKNLVDESVVLTIANKTVRERMLSISESAKAIENTNKELRFKIYDLENKNKELRFKIYDLENKNKELQAKVDEIDKIVEHKAEEMLKEIERKKYGYAIGDKVYIIEKHEHLGKEICPVCKGSGKVSIENQQYECPKCHGYKEIDIFVEEKPTYFEAEIYENRVNFYNEYNTFLGTLAYTNDKISKYGTLGENKIYFKTEKEAKDFIENFQQEQVND